MAPVEERRGLLSAPDEHLLTAAGAKRPGGRRPAAPADRGIAAVGGRIGRGPGHGEIFGYLVALLLGQSMGHRPLRNRHRPLPFDHRTVHKAAQPCLALLVRRKPDRSGPGGEEFFQAGGLVWMVHHGLATGQTGDLAQRHLYVGFLAFPSGQLPRIAIGDAAAALAEGVLYSDDPNLPASPRSAYLTILKRMTGSFSGDSDQSVLADGALSCRDLGHHEDAKQMLRSFQKGGLTAFESYLVAIFSTRYFCSQYVTQAVVDVRQSLVNVS